MPFIAINRSARNARKVRNLRNAIIIAHAYSLTFDNFGSSFSKLCRTIPIPNAYEIIEFTKGTIIPKFACA